MSFTDFQLFFNFSGLSTIRFYNDVIHYWALHLQMCLLYFRIRLVVYFCWYVNGGSLRSVLDLTMNLTEVWVSVSGIRCEVRLWCLTLKIMYQSGKRSLIVLDFWWGVLMGKRRSFTNVCARQQPDASGKPASNITCGHTDIHLWS